MKNMHECTNERVSISNVMDFVSMRDCFSSLIWTMQMHALFSRTMCDRYEC